ncbi:hypothetical protein BSKO_14115 [Bryopsis sp. KO-2023]|nr:hypothetical protein BSKO_14115 [Bryopsis sp. KO-2023]
MFTAGIPGALERLKSLKAARKEKRKEKDRWDASQRLQKNDSGSEVPMDSATSMENIKRAKLDHPPPCEGKKKSEKKKSDGKKSEKKKIDGEKSEKKKCEGRKSEKEKCEGPSLETAPALVQDVVQDLRDCKEAIDEKLRVALARFGGDYDQQQEMEGSNTPQDSASQVVGGAEDNNRERSRDERLGETSTYDQRPKDLFVGESPCRIDVSTVSARMLITDRTKGPRNKMNKPTYIYGNYPNYYWVRTEDSRIEVKNPKHTLLLLFFLFYFFQMCYIEANRPM